MKQPKDMEPDELGPLSWDQDHIEESLAKLYKYANDRAKKAIKWYDDKRVWSRRWGSGLRYVAIVFTAVAGIIPVLGSIAPKQGIPEIDPGWSAVAFGIAAMFLALERFGGRTSAWIRYVLAAQEIEQALDEFRFGWQKERLVLSDPMDCYAAKPMIEKCCEFVLLVERIVNKETQQWAAEFQSAVKELDEASRTAAQSARARLGPATFGAITVEIENGSDCAKGWKLRVDGENEKLCHGKRCALTRISPGFVIVEADGVIGDKDVTDSVPVKVVAGKTAQAKLKLE